MPIVLVISNENLLSKNLNEELVKKSCKVVHVKNSEELKNYFTLHEIPEYLFYIDVSHERNFFSRIEVNRIFKFVEDYSPKTQVILSYVVNSKNKKRIKDTAKIARRIKNRNLQIMYLGDIYEDDVNPYPDMWKGKRILVPKYDVNLYLIDLKTAIHLLMKGIFSYGFSKKEVTAAYPTTAFNIAKKIRYFSPLTEFLTSNDIKQTENVSNFDFLKVSLNEESLSKSIYVESKEVKEIKKVKQVKRYTKKTKPFFFAVLVFWIFSIPFLSLFISSITVREGIKNLESYNFNAANTYFKLTEVLSKISTNSFIFFEEGRKVSLVLNEFSSVGLKSILLLTDLQNIPYSNDVQEISNRLFLETDDLSKKISFLTADIEDISYSKFFVPTTDLQKANVYLSNSKVFVQNLSQLLGEGRKSNYLVLFQDTSELRATGGLIDSFGIISFENGKLTEKNFYDTSQIDKSFTGQVEPPLALKKYLGINNWRLVDSNWNTDASIDAAKAEWFYENETGKKIDGVIFVNSNFEKYFTNFDGNFLEWGMGVIDGLSSKDIIIFLNDGKFSSALSSLNWDGKIKVPTCGDNCKSIWMSFNESNLGLNKVNPFIERSGSVISSFSGNDINTKFEVDYNNTSSTLPYRVYLRLSSLAESNFEKVKITNGGITQNISPEINFTNDGQEAALLINVPAGKTASVIFNFKVKNNLNLNKSGELLYYIRKQPGVYFFPLSVRVNLPQSLTSSSPTSYNTNLTHDENYIISW